MPSPYHFNPSCFRIAFTSPVPNSFLLPCIGRTDCLPLSLTIKWPPLPGSNVQPSLARWRLNWALVTKKAYQICCVSSSQKHNISDSFSPRDCLFDDPTPTPPHESHTAAQRTSTPQCTSRSSTPSNHTPGSRRMPPPHTGRAPAHPPHPTPAPSRSSSARRA